MRALVLLILTCWTCLLSLALTGCPVPQDQNTPVEPKFLIEPLTHRAYYLYVPSTYRRDRPSPLIITCHGTDPFDVAASQVGEWRMLAEQYGCLLVCPKLTSTDGILGAGALDQLLADEKLIMSILGKMHYEFNIDRRNVLMTGFSGGGFPVYFVGLRHPDVFTAVSARACNFNRNAVDGWYPPDALKLPVQVYYGENDAGAIRDQSDQAIAYLRSAGFRVTTSVIPSIGHERRPEEAMGFWLHHWNGTPPMARNVAHR